MIWIVLPMLTMLIGLLMGVCIMDTFDDNKQINQLERRIKRLERRAKEGHTKWHILTESFI